MGGSISHERDRYSLLSINIVRYAALLLPLTVTVYVVLAEYNLVPRSPWYAQTTTSLVTIFALAISLWQFVTKPTSQKSSFIYLVLYHLIASLFVLFVSGFATPVLTAWLVLLIVTDLFFSSKGVLYSLAVLGSVMFISFSMTDLSLASFVTYFTYTGIIVITGYLVNWMGSVQEVEHEDFLASRDQQMLQQTRLNVLVNSINEAIISINAAGVIQIYNAATLNLIDTNQSIVGRNLNDIFQTYDKAGDPVDLFASLSKDTKTIQRDDLKHRFADGEMLSLGISSAAIRNNSPTSHNEIEGYILIIRDITNSKSLEEERDEFIAVVSHELRTPITIAEGTVSNLQLLIDRGADPKVLATSLEAAHEQILYLAKMVNDLSTLSRAERGVADAAEEINVTDLMHDLYTEYEPKAKKKGLTLNLDCKGKLGTVNVSRLYLEEIIQNFITNSIKYTQEGSITLSAHREGSKILFAVKDTGIGVSKSDQKRLFEKFFRSEDYRTRETSGTGLGLYVVQKLSHKLGTKIEFTSRLNHGSTFSFTLKASKTPIDARPHKG